VKKLSIKKNFDFPYNQGRRQEGEGEQLGQFGLGLTLLGAPATLSGDRNTLIEQSLQYNK